MDAALEQAARDLAVLANDTVTSLVLPEDTRAATDKLDFGVEPSAPAQARAEQTSSQISLLNDSVSNTQDIVQETGSVTSASARCSTACCSSLLESCCLLNCMPHFNWLGCQVLPCNSHGQLLVQSQWQPCCPGSDASWIRRCIKGDCRVVLPVKAVCMYHADSADSPVTDAPLCLQLLVPLPQLHPAPGPARARKDATRCLPSRSPTRPPPLPQQTLKLPLLRLTVLQQTRCAHTPCASARPTPPTLSLKVTPPAGSAAGRSAWTGPSITM